MKNIVLVLFAVLPFVLFAAYFENLPTEVIQPDGSVLNLLASGDEFANRLHDSAGFTILQDPGDGYYYYAISSEGEPVPSDYRVDFHDPVSLGLRPGVNISPEEYRERVQLLNSQVRGSRSPNTGTVNNLVVYIRFSDQTEFSEPRSVYDAKFNAEGEDQYSLRNYYHQVSYDQLNFVSHHFPACSMDINLSYQDSHPRSYYMPYNGITNPEGYQDYQRTEREHTLLANAIASIAAQVPAVLNIDADNDGYVDNVCFIIRGPHSAWNNLLWAHRWALYTEDSFINNKQVWDFTFQPENHNGVRTLCHEMFHSVGAPDLYHYDFDGLSPAGCWDIMESGGGHMGMYMKYRYGGWIDNIPEIGPGTYTMQPVTEEFNNVYRISVSANEYLVLEFRKQDSDIFEANLPGSGLLIYRIRPTGEGNSDGPPDEVYIYRPDGSTSVNGRISEAAFSAQAYQTEFNQHTNPASVSHYGSPYAVNIHSISTAGETITFTLGSSSGMLPPVISGITPLSGTILNPGSQILSANVSAPGDDLDQVEFWVDNQLLGQTAYQPYQIEIPADLLGVGYHDLKIIATTFNQMSSSKVSRIRIVNPLEQTWFSWLSNQPVWEEFGRGAVPITVALELDLGIEEYLVRKLAINAVADAWGFPESPGLIGVKINRFAAGAITETTLLDLGYLYHAMEGREEFIINSGNPISGKIAVIVNLYDYQNIVFDTNSPCGHSWLTEPNRPWTDALGRGVIGSAAIELLLENLIVDSEDEQIPAPVLQLSNYPNPFSGATTLSFELKSPQKVRMAIYNIRGQKLVDILDENLASGSHRIDWNGMDASGRAVSSGIYFCRLDAGGQVALKRLAVVRSTGVRRASGERIESD